MGRWSLFFNNTVDPKKTKYEKETYNNTVVI